MLFIFVCCTASTSKSRVGSVSDTIVNQKSSSKDGHHGKHEDRSREHVSRRNSQRSGSIALTNSTASQAVAVGMLEEQVAQIMVMMLLTSLARTEEKDMIAAPVDTRVGERGMIVAQADCHMVEETTVAQTGKVSNGMGADGINSQVE